MKFIRKIMRFGGSPKKKNEEIEPSAEERLLGLQKEYEDNKLKIEQEYDRKKGDLENTYLLSIFEEDEQEINKPFHEITIESENGTRPLIYESTKGSYFTTHYMFSRGEFSPNPYSIVVDDYKNCMFLNVHKKGEEKSCITLYYDKPIKKFSEYEWLYPCDFVMKQQVKVYLFTIMQHILQDRLSFHPSYLNAIRGHALFFEKFKENEEALYMQYEREVDALHKEKELRLLELLQNFEGTNLLLQKEVEKEKAKIRLMSFIPTEMPQEEKEFTIFDHEVESEMKKLFQRLYRLLSIDTLLDAMSKHDLRTLYEKDVQELWYHFMQLDSDKQQHEKPRFLSLLGSIHLQLDEMEEKIKTIETFDYEKKMMYLEKKFLKK